MERSLLEHPQDMDLCPGLQTVIQGEALHAQCTHRTWWSPCHAEHQPPADTGPASISGAELPPSETLEEKMQEKLKVLEIENRTSSWSQPPGGKLSQQQRHGAVNLAQPQTEQSAEEEEEQGQLNGTAAPGSHAEEAKGVRRKRRERKRRTRRQRTRRVR